LVECRLDKGAGEDRTAQGWPWVAVGQEWDRRVSGQDSTAVWGRRVLWDRTDLIVVGCSGIWGSLGWYLRVGLRHDEGAGENTTANRWGTEWSGTGRGLARVVRYRQCRREGVRCTVTC
jgi:hypothetical protein